MESLHHCVVYKTSPLEHQQAYMRHWASKRRIMINGEMGTGKTWMAINNAFALFAEGMCDGLLVLAPNGVHTNWIQNELLKHAPEETTTRKLRYKAAAWYASPNKKDKAALANLFTDDKALPICAMNWDAISTKKGFDFAMAFLRRCADAMLVADESDCAKNPSSARTKALMKLKPYATWRRTMSGTPINNSPFDLFSQYGFLDTDILGTTSFLAFKSEHAVLLKRGNPLFDDIVRRTGKEPALVAKDPHGKPLYRNLDLLAKRIAPHTFRISKEECLDLPPKVYKRVYFEMAPEQRRLYERMEGEFRLELDGKDTPVPELASVGKLSQITSGFVMHPGRKEPVRIGDENPKLAAFKSLAERLIAAGHKLIVWARYVEEIEDIKRTLSEMQAGWVEYQGSTHRKDRADAVSRFEDGLVDVFIGNQQAAGVGITLIAASQVVYYSNSFSLRDRLQSEDRAHRIGQTKSVTYWEIVGRDTIDEIILNAIERKEDIAQAVVGNIARRNR